MHGVSAAGRAIASWPTSTRRPRRSFENTQKRARFGPFRLARLPGMPRGIAPVSANLLLRLVAFLTTCTWPGVRTIQLRTLNRLGSVRSKQFNLGQRGAG